MDFFEGEGREWREERGGEGREEDYEEEREDEEEEGGEPFIVLVGVFRAGCTDSSVAREGGGPTINHCESNRRQERHRHEVLHRRRERQRRCVAAGVLFRAK